MSWHLAVYLKQLGISQQGTIIMNIPHSTFFNASRTHKCIRFQKFQKRLKLLFMKLC